MAWSFLNVASAEPLARHGITSTASSLDRDTGSGEPLGLERWRPIAQRYGEARHPGPEDLVWITTSNPGGLRDKEDLLLDLGSGIHALSETHLSRVTQPLFARALARQAARLNRQVRVHSGFPAALRANSQWAGTWTGVTICSDFPSQSLRLSWEDDIWQSSRIQATMHRVGHHQILVANVYGYAKGPTWPRAKELTNSLLAHLTRHLVVGYGGLAVIAGDMNFDPGELDEHLVWQSYGWQNAQTLARDRWNQEILPTCKGATERDQLWISPMLASLCQEVRVDQHFADHATVSAAFRFQQHQVLCQSWPRPSPIPWDRVDLTGWTSSGWSLNIDESGSTTEQLRQMCAQYEASLSGYIRDQPGWRLTNTQQGRAARTKPLSRTVHPPTCSSHRPGEEALVNDLAGRKTIAWYRQLRRLQSYLHSIRRGSDTTDAVLHRVELWSAILRARGFQRGFPIWWHEAGLDNWVGPLSPDPPTRIQAELFFEAFRRAFRDFEQWHGSERNALLSAKRDRTIKALFQDLKAPGTDQISHLWDDSSYQILAVDDQSSLVHLDSQVRDAPHSTWTLDNVPVHITRTDGDLVEIAGGHPLPLSELQQRVHHSQCTEVHHELKKLWGPRWFTDSAPPLADLQRLADFVEASLPRCDLSLPPLSLKEWKSSMRRFRDTAARGVDGINKGDLMHFTDQQHGFILRMLSAIEDGNAEWPQQMLEGLVIALAKPGNDGSKSSHYRPIVLLSMLYRNWASLRSRQLLQRISRYIPEDVHGFLPGREPMHTWLQIQATVEVSLQSGTDLVGLSTDVVKAFNAIRREPLFQLASHLGVESSIIRPWKSFLHGMGRRFQVHNQLGPRLISNIGYPEGCPLSVVAMALLDWGLHEYMRIYAPSARTFSFVDNLNVQATQASIVVMAFFALRTYMDLWGLLLDKTFVWATTASSRKAISGLGVECKRTTNELGGSLSFQAGRHSKVFRTRGDNLEAKWDRLQRSRQPLRMKLQGLPISVWAAVLHGASGSLVASQYLHELRKKATRSLGLMKGGANSWLRLALSDPPQADPGYYHLIRTLFEFRRLMDKLPDLRQLWMIFHARFDGRMFDGPFSKLADLFSLLGWHIITPPRLQTHEALEIDFFQIDNAALVTLVQDGWLRYVANHVNKRKSLNGLDSIDLYLSTIGDNQLEPHRLAQIKAIQEGAFIAPGQQAKYDGKKQAMCPQCNVPELQTHWLFCPQYIDIRQRLDISLDELQGVPDFALQHLLAPVSPLVAEIHRKLLQIPDAFEFWSTPSTQDQVQHLFTDGSKTDQIFPHTEVASWGVINSSTGLVISAAPLSGIAQTIGRAELTAVICAIEWTLHFRTSSVIWSDCQAIVRRAQSHILGHSRVDEIRGQNHDLWLRLGALLDAVEQSQVQVEWTPSHLNEATCESLQEEWQARWNGQADALATEAHKGRYRILGKAIDDLVGYYTRWSTLLRKLRSFYLEVASRRQEAQSHEVEDEQVVHIDDTNWEEIVGPTALLSHCPSRLPAEFGERHPRVSTEFVELLVSRLTSFEDETMRQSPLSFIEIAMLMLQTESFSVPVQSQSDGTFLLRPVGLLHSRPTVAQLVHWIRIAFKTLCTFIGRIEYLVRGLDRSHNCISSRCDGILVRPSVAAQGTARRLVLEFAPRGIRRAADLARPLP